MISIMRAGTGPAFHIVCISPRGLVMYPPAANTTWPDPGPETNLALRDNRILIFSGVQMRRHQRTDRERVLHHRHLTVGVLAPQLELHTDRTQITHPAGAWLHHSQPRSIGSGHRHRLLRGRCTTRYNR